MQILFLGNSYTFFNDLWTLFRRCAGSAGCDLRVEHVTAPGYYLRQFLDPADPIFPEFQAKTRDHFDFALLQEQSAGPITDFQGFAAAVRALRRALPRTQLVLFETWGRREGSGDLKKLGLDSLGMTEALSEAYRRVGAELDIPVSPVGRAFRDVYVNHPEIDVYAPDGSHPSPAGSYLAALVHFGAVTGADPSVVEYDGGLGDVPAGILRAAASRALGRAGENTTLK